MSKNPGDKLISVENLSVNYDKKQAIWDMSFSVPSGHLIGIVGPNGAGKSTLVKAMMGLADPLSGVVSYCGKSLGEMKGKIAYVCQRSSVDWDFPITVFEVVLMGLYGKLGLFKRPSKLDRERVMEILKIIGMEKMHSRQIGDLSGGQQQRLFVARALLQDADVFFLDEPFAGIDMATEKLLIGLLRDLVKKGKTVFIVHHDLKTVESYFDYLIMLNLRLIKAGLTRDVFNQDSIASMFCGASHLLGEAIKLTGEKSGGIR